MEKPEKKRLDDFGERIPGARKHTARKRLSSGTSGEPEGTASWPRPAWLKLAEVHRQEGRNPRDLALTRTMRDVLLRPGRRYSEQRLATSRSTESLVELALDLMEGNRSHQEVLDQLRRSVGPRQTAMLRLKMQLYAAAGHENDLRYVTIRETVSNTIVVWVQGEESFQSATIEAAGQELRARLRGRAGAQTQTLPKQPYLAGHITRDGEKQYGVWRKGPRSTVLVHRCESGAEAQRMIKEEREALDDWWKKWRTIPATRRPVNRPRTPAGADGTVEPDIFRQRYRFRGVQFGKWVNNEERERSLANGSQALADLATALGWPAEALALYDRLGLAFGARGKGGPRRAVAHYESFHQVIALTKRGGSGSLAHEWFHAFDHYIGTFTTRYLGSYATEEADRPGSVDPRGGKLAAALWQYGRRLRESALRQRSSLLDLRRARSKAYWSTTIELAARVFETWVRRRLAILGIRNDYLVNFTAPEEWPADKGLSRPYPYPYASELEYFGRDLDEIAALGTELPRAPDARGAS